MSLMLPATQGDATAAALLPKALVPLPVIGPELVFLAELPFGTGITLTLHPQDPEL